MRIQNLEHFMRDRELGESSFAEVQKNTYKYTGCGARVEELDNHRGLLVTCIVEGSEACFSRSFAYPFHLKDFWAYLDELEFVTDMAWKEANVEVEV
jgi:hypothetical protein